MKSNRNLGAGAPTGKQFYWCTYLATTLLVHLLIILVLSSCGFSGWFYFGPLRDRGKTTWLTG
jgi:hypothetical protein